MDNFDLHKYLKNNPLLAESTDNKLTRGKLKEMVREMVKPEVANTPDETNLGKAIGAATNVKAKLKLINQPTELDGTFELTLDYSDLKDIPKSTIMAALKRAMDQLSPETSTINTVGDPIGPNSKDFAGPTQRPDGTYDISDMRPIRTMREGEINEMARIAKPSKLADNWEEQMANLPDRFKKSTRFDRVIKYFQKYNDKIGQPIDPNTDPLTAKAIDYYGTLAHIADEEFQSSDTASAAPIVAALKDAGIVVAGDFVTEPAKYSKEPSVPGAKGRPKTETGYFQNAMSKFKEGNYDFSAEEKNALENMVKALQAALTKKPEPAAKKK
jgi:hypothetical protein